MSKREVSVWSHNRMFHLRPSEKGVYYVHWTDGRRSKRVSTRQAALPAAQAFLTTWLELFGAEQEQLAVYTCADLWELKYGRSRRDASVGAATLESAGYKWPKLEPVFGHLMPSEVTKELVRKYLRDRERAGAAPSTRRLELSLLYASWNFAVKERLLASTDLPLLDPLPEASPPRERWLRDEEVQRLFDAAAARRKGDRLSRLERFLWLALETGARRTAILQLTWEQVDWETGVVHYLKPGAAQTRKRKASVPISEALRPVLLRAYEEREGNYVLDHAGKINGSVASLAKAAGVAGVTPHVMRHTTATRLARAGVPIWLIAKILGNSVEQIEKVYAKHAPEFLADAVNQIGGTRGEGKLRVVK